MSGTTEPGTLAADPQLARLVALRESLRSEHRAAATPAVGRALETADYYLLIALSYLGYVDHLFPEQVDPFELT